MGDNGDCKEYRLGIVFTDSVVCLRTRPEAGLSFEAVASCGTYGPLKVRIGDVKLFEFRFSSLGEVKPLGNAMMLRISEHYKKWISACVKGFQGVSTDDRVELQGSSSKNLRVIECAQLMQQQ